MSNTTVRVSVGVSAKKERELEALGLPAIENFARDIGLMNLNTIDVNKFKKYGTLIGSVEIARLDALRDTPEVDFVEEIGRKFAT